MKIENFNKKVDLREIQKTLAMNRRLKNVNNVIIQISCFGGVKL